MSAWYIYVVIARFTSVRATPCARLGARDGTILVSSNGLKPVSNQYKPGPIERMLILNVGQQQLLRSL